MPQDDVEDAGALDLDYKDAEYKVPSIPFKKYDRYRKRKDGEEATSPSDGTVANNEGDGIKEGQGQGSDSQRAAEALEMKAGSLTVSDGQVLVCQVILLF